MSIINLDYQRVCEKFSSRVKAMARKNEFQGEGIFPNTNEVVIWADNHHPYDGEMVPELAYYYTETNRAEMLDMLLGICGVDRSQIPEWIQKNIAEAKIKGYIQE